jgi:hypothetical protein
MENNRRSSRIASSTLRLFRQEQIKQAAILVLGSPFSERDVMKEPKDKPEPAEPKPLPQERPSEQQDDSKKDR